MNAAVDGCDSERNGGVTSPPPFVNSFALSNRRGVHCAPASMLKMGVDMRLCNCSELNLTIALIFHSPFSIFNYCNKKGTLFRGFLFMQLWFVKRRNYSSTLTYTPPLRQDSVAALAMRTGRRPSIAPTAVWVSLLIASTKEITWLMNAWL